MQFSALASVLVTAVLSTQMVWSNTIESELPACSQESDVKHITTSADLGSFNDPLYRVFCIYPGDYSGASPQTITLDGEAGQERVIRTLDLIAPWEAEQASRSIVPKIVFNGASHWIVHGVTFDGAGDRSLEVRQNSDHVKVIAVLIQNCGGSCAYWGTGSDDGLLQGSVLRNTGLGIQESHNLFMSAGSTSSAPGETGVHRMSIIGNEFSDAQGDNIQVWVSDKDNPVDDFRGLRIVDNDFFMTSAMYVDASGNRSSNGEFACAENAIDFKVAVKGDNVSIEDYVAIESNRFWGFRKTHLDSPLCDELSSWGRAVIFHKVEADYAIVKNNVFFDAVNGIVVQGGADNILIEGNVFHGLSNTEGGRGALEITTGGQVEVKGNVVVDSQTYLKAGGDDATITDNQFVLSGKWATTNGEDFSGNSDVGNNKYLATDEVYDGAADSGENEIASQPPVNDFCFSRQKLTSGEIVCLGNVPTQLGVEAPIDTAPAAPLLL